MTKENDPKPNDNPALPGATCYAVREDDHLRCSCDEPHKLPACRGYRKHAGSEWCAHNYSNEGLTDWCHFVGILTA